MIANLTVLRTFVAVVECGSVVASARALGYSASAVSRQMAWLQRRLGVTLFRPDGRSIRPTDEALKFLQPCRTLIEEVRRFETYAASFPSLAQEPKVIKANDWTT